MLITLRSLLLRGNVLNASEQGDDTFDAAARLIVTGQLAVSEAGQDSFAASGQVIFTGRLKATETGPDAFLSAGDVPVSGVVNALEGRDQTAITGKVLVEGALAVAEGGADAARATGKVVVEGALVASESGADTATATGAIDVPFMLTPQQALLLRRLHQLHGLADPLVVGRASRRAGDLQQSVQENSVGEVTVSTTAGHSTVAGSIGQMIEELAALHGLTAPLVVTATGRSAGGIVQSFSTAGATTTVTRQ